MERVLADGGRGGDRDGVGAVSRGEDAAGAGGVGAAGGVERAVHGADRAAEFGDGDDLAGVRGGDPQFVRGVRESDGTFLSGDGAAAQRGSGGGAGAGDRGNGGAVLRPGGVDAGAPARAGECADGGVLGAARDPTGIYPLAGAADRADADDGVADGRVGAAVPRGGGGERASGVRRRGDAAGGRGDPVSGRGGGGDLLHRLGGAAEAARGGDAVDVRVPGADHGDCAQRVVLRGTAAGDAAGGWSAGAARSVGGDAGLNAGGDRDAGRVGHDLADAVEQRGEAEGFREEGAAGAEVGPDGGVLGRIPPRHVNDRGLRAIDGELHRKLEAGAVAASARR